MTRSSSSIRKRTGRINVRGGNGSGKSTMLAALKAEIKNRAYYWPTTDRLAFKFAEGIEPEGIEEREHRSRTAGRGGRDRTAASRKKLGFSSGERQLKSLQEIMRFTDASIYLLDEWDANLDTKIARRPTSWSQSSRKRARVIEISHRDRGVGCVGRAAPYSPTNSARRCAAERPRADPPCRRRAAVRRPALIGQNGVIRVAAPPSPEGLPHDRSLRADQPECAENLHHARGVRAALQQIKLSTSGRAISSSRSSSRSIPTRKVPAIVDHDGPGGKPYTVFESGAILLYLADKTGKFLPAGHARKRFEVIQWMMVQMTGIGPAFGQTVHFKMMAPAGQRLFAQPLHDRNEAAL